MGGRNTRAGLIVLLFFSFYGQLAATQEASRNSLVLGNETERSVKQPTQGLEQSKDPSELRFWISRTRKSLSRAKTKQNIPRKNPPVSSIERATEDGPCPQGFYGQDCSQRCPKNCQGNCNKDNGTCNGCAKTGQWGDYCNNTCYHCNNNSCHFWDGTCTSGENVTYYQVKYCNDSHKPISNTDIISTYIYPTVVSILGIIIIALIVPIVLNHFRCPQRSLKGSKLDRFERSGAHSHTNSFELNRLETNCE